MASTVTCEWYRDSYGGSLSEAAFGEPLPLADAHVRWLCAVKGAKTTRNVFKRAVCAAVDALAEYGAGEVGGYTIGEFSVKNHASQQTTGKKLATAAALRGLGPCPRPGLVRSSSLRWSLRVFLHQSLYRIENASPAFHGRIQGRRSREERFLWVRAVRRES